MTGAGDVDSPVGWLVERKDSVDAGLRGPCLFASKDEAWEWKRSAAFPWTDPVPVYSKICRDRLAAELAAARAEAEAEKQRYDEVLEAADALRAEAKSARDNALREAEAIATRAGEEMTERGAWDEGMRDMAVRIIMRLLAARTAGGSTHGR